MAAVQRSAWAMGWTIGGNYEDEERLSALEAWRGEAIVQIEALAGALENLVAASGERPTPWMPLMRPDPARRALCRYCRNATHTLIERRDHEGDVGHEVRMVCRALPREAYSDEGQRMVGAEILQRIADVRWCGVYERHPDAPECRESVPDGGKVPVGDPGAGRSRGAGGNQPEMPPIGGDPAGGESTGVRR